MNDLLARSAAGIVLCGGASRRMGRSKAWLPFGAETMLQRTVRRLADAVTDVSVVAAVGQELPPLSADVRIVRDDCPEQGPLAGFAAGLRNVPTHVDVVFLVGCDVPLLRPEYVRRVIALPADADCVVPLVDGVEQPLGAVYRRDLLPKIDAALRDGRRSLRSLFELVDAVRISAETLREVDPQLDSLRACNTPEEYRQALSDAELAPE